MHGLYTVRTQLLDSTRQVTLVAVVANALRYCAVSLAVGTRVGHWKDAKVILGQSRRACAIVLYILYVQAALLRVVLYAVVSSDLVLPVDFATSAPFFELPRFRRTAAPPHVPGFGRALRVALSIPALYSILRAFSRSLCR